MASYQLTDERTAKRARVDAALTMTTRGADNDTALYIAAAKGHDAVVRTLLDAGADKDLARNDGVTPLMIAAQTGHAAVVCALLDAGANKTARCDGKTALDAAETTEIRDLLV